MPDLLLELVSEEIPARMQRKAADDLRKLVTDALVERGLVYEGAKAFATPRRLSLHVAGLPVRGRDVREERKGPRVGAPEAAVQGFLKAAGLVSLDQATIVSDPKKGDSYVAVTEKPGQETVAAIAEIVPAVIRAFPWPKSMRWGKASAEPGSLRWVRPLHAILCTFGAETEEPEVVPFAVDGIVSGNLTHGHRFHAPGAITVRRFEDYVASLERAKVVLDADRRKEIILNDARTLVCRRRGSNVVAGRGAAGRGRGGWSNGRYVLLGSHRRTPSSTLPPETMQHDDPRVNQRCFALREAATERRRQPLRAAHRQPGGASDGGDGDRRGERARRCARASPTPPISSATDKADLRSRHARGSAELGLDLLDQRMAKLDRLGVVFHAKLGTQGAASGSRIAAAGAGDSRRGRGRVMRRWPMTPRARRSSPRRTSPIRDGRRVPRTAGRDGPELRAELQGEHAVGSAAAIGAHYRPLGPGDERARPSQWRSAVALADKIDQMLTGFFRRSARSRQGP
jgi:glycyl-tRNA synthetase beta chain